MKIKQVTILIQSTKEIPAKVIGAVSNHQIAERWENGADIEKSIIRTISQIELDNVELLNEIALHNKW